MKLVADGTTLQAAISWVTATFDGRDDKAFVALEVNENGEGFLYHQNSTSYMKKPFGVQSIEFDDEDDTTEVVLALEGHYLTKLKDALDSGPIKLTKKLSEKNDPLLGRTKEARFTIPILDMQAPAAPKTTTIGEVDEAEFFDYIRRLSDICEKNAGVYPATTAVDFNFNVAQKQLSLMATDRYVVAELTLDFDQNEKSDSNYLSGDHVLLPSEAARLQLNSKSGGMVELVTDSLGGKFGYVFPDGGFALFTVKDASPVAIAGMKKASTRSKDAVDGLIEDDWNTAEINAAELRRAIKIVLDLSWNEDYVFVTSKDGKLIISDSAGTNKVSVSAKIKESAPLAVKFTKSTIQTALRPVTSADVVIRWKNEDFPFVLDQVLEDSKVDDKSLIIFVPSKG